MNDPANFDRQDLRVIWGDYPRCLIRPTLAADDWHHILSRGYSFGIGPNHQYRALFSSVFNAAPICRDAHDQEPLHRNALRDHLLQAVIKKAVLAVTDGLYELTEIDRRFLMFIEDWGENPRAVRLVAKVMTAPLVGPDRASTPIV